MKLPNGALLRIENDDECCAIRCLAGTLWITQERDVTDHLIAAGDDFEITQPGLTLVQALDPASIRLSREGKRCSKVQR